MATAFMVTQGEYSDYTVLAVFTERGGAEKYAALYPAGYYAVEIEEVPLNEQPDAPVGCLRYSVKFDRQGDCTVKHEAPTNGYEDCRPYGDGQNMLTYCWAHDEQHAAKIANERRTKVVADDEWETDFNVYRNRKMSKLNV
jgi:hypothetical protein